MRCDNIEKTTDKQTEIEFDMILRNLNDYVKIMVDVERRLRVLEHKIEELENEQNSVSVMYG